MSTTSGRRDQIAEAGIRVIARRGVRALTHRAVDEEAALPPGSTSYYARTRSALIDEIARVLAERSVADLEDAANAMPVPGEASAAARDELLAALIKAVDALARRSEELKVRWALLLELDHDDAARATLTARSPVHQQMAQRLTDGLKACGIAAATERAEEVMNLCDALLMQPIITGAPVRAAPILSAYIYGLDDSTGRSGAAGQARRRQTS